ncbi:MAG TPA: LPS assembly lipoprotein LptE [Novosphingobium sp.]|nr:LPS assembly lipoprotein LptE [Novosphingobium sp.]HZV08852.1 LPS assembly lipoprotein LptE [Novosphingobium sp.]
MKRIAGLAALALAGASLSACGLHPLYEGGGHAAAASGLAGVQITPIQGRAGWLMSAALADRVQARGSARYRLDVKLEDKLEGLGILSNDTVSRERRTLRARYQLVDLATGAILLDQTAGSDEGIDPTSSEYATVAGEQTALENLTRVVADRIVANLAVALRARAAHPPAQGQ